MSADDLTVTMRRIVGGERADRAFEMKYAGRHSNAVVRPADRADARLLFEWVNDPAARAASINPAAISWEEHVRWFADRIQSPRCRIWIIEADGEPVGQIRYELNPGNEAIVSFTVLASRRGQGFGTDLIRQTQFSAWRDLQPVALVAVCRSDNAASAAAFLRTGFTEVDRRIIAGSEFRTFEWKAPR